MKLRVVDLNPAVVYAIGAAFKDVPDSEFIVGRFDEHLADVDCVVSPANSFGFMDGGFDGALTTYFGQTLQQRVRSIIAREWRGEQPVGTCVIVPTGIMPPWCAHVPTMRVPKRVAGTDAVYLAMRALLLGIDHHNERVTVDRRIERVLMPGLGTATGGVVPESAAAQMRLAWDVVTEPLKSLEWQDALNREWRVQAAASIGETA